MRMLICGSRNFPSDFYDLVRLTVLNQIPCDGTQVTLIEGGATGADAMAKRIGREHAMTVKTYPADWSTHGKAAGAIRNQQMLDEGNPTDVWCFTDEETMSPGTKDMFDRAISHKLNVRHYYLKLERKDFRA